MPQSAFAENVCCVVRRAGCFEVFFSGPDEKRRWVKKKEKAARARGSERGGREKESSTASSSEASRSSSERSSSRVAAGVVVDVEWRRERERGTTERFRVRPCRATRSAGERRLEREKESVRDGAAADMQCCAVRWRSQRVWEAGRESAGGRRADAGSDLPRAAGGWEGFSTPGGSDGGLGREWERVSHTRR